MVRGCRDGTCGAPTCWVCVDGDCDSEPTCPETVGNNNPSPKKFLKNKNNVTGSKTSKGNSSATTCGDATNSSNSSQKTEDSDGSTSECNKYEKAKSSNAGIEFGKGQASDATSKPSHPKEGQSSADAVRSSAAMSTPGSKDGYGSWNGNSWNKGRNQGSSTGKNTWSQGGSNKRSKNKTDNVKSWRTETNKGAAGDWKPTRLCRHFFFSGKCWRGEECSFAHGQEEIKPGTSKHEAQTFRSAMPGTTTGALSSPSSPSSKQTTFHSMPASPTGATVATPNATMSANGMQTAISANATMSANGMTANIVNLMPATQILPGGLIPGAAAFQ